MGSNPISGTIVSIPIRFNELGGVERYTPVSSFGTSRVPEGTELPPDGTQLRETKPQGEPWGVFVLSRSGADNTLGGISAQTARDLLAPQRRGRSVEPIGKAPACDAANGHLRRSANYATLLKMNANLGLGNASGTTAPGASQWPSHFPACCPPADADDLGGPVFLLVATDPPTAPDLESAKERDTFKGKDECRRASLSCGVTLEYITELRDNSPRLKYHLIASARLTAADGKIKQVGSPGHHSMWLRRASLQNGTTLFQVTA